MVQSIFYDLFRKVSPRRDFFADGIAIDFVLHLFYSALQHVELEMASQARELLSMGAEMFKAPAFLFANLQ
jgi:hypothetical protein